MTALENGLALAGDYMSAASFLGIAGLVALRGYDGMIYATGWLVGWPALMFLIAEPVRNLGKFTFADVVAFRLRQVPVRIASACGGILTVLFYTIAQMVGAGNLIRLMFGIPYEWAVTGVGIVMLAYVLFGGMIATTWVQIIKAVLLLLGVTLLTVLVLAQFDFSPPRLYAAVAERYGQAALEPGGLVTDPLDAVSLGLALMFGLLGLPHILMRFYTVPDARTARASVLYATGFIGYFYLIIPIVGFGASALVGRELIASVDAGGNMAAPLAAELLGGTAFLGFIAAVAFATILAVVAGPDARRRERAVPRHLRARGPRRPCAGPRTGPRRARVDCGLRRTGGPAGRRLQGTERRVHGGTGVRDRVQRKLSAPAALDRVEALHDGRRRQLDHHRRRPVRPADRAQPDGLGRSLPQHDGDLPAAQPRHHLDAGGVPRRIRRVADVTRADGRGNVRGREDQDLPGGGGGVALGSRLIEAAVETPRQPHVGCCPRVSRPAAT